MSEDVQKIAISQAHLYTYSFIFLFAYLIIGFVPVFGALDRIGPQWLYLNLVSLVSITYLIKNNKYYYESINVLLKTKFFWLYVVFGFWTLGSYFYAINSLEALVNIARIIGTVIAFFNLFIHLYKIPNKFQVVAFALSGILLIEMYLVFDPLLELIKKGIDPSRSLALRGTTGNINVAAMSMVIKIPFVLYLINIAQKYWQKIIYGILIALTIFCLVFVASRASYVALIVIFLTYSFFYLYNYFITKKSKQLLLPILYFLVPLVISIGVSQLIAETTNGTDFFERSASIVETVSDGSISKRLRFYAAGIDYMFSHPIFGSGIGNWKLVSIFYEKEFMDSYIVPYHAHNDFIQIGGELGIPGLLMYGGIFGMILAYFVFILKSKASEKTNLFSILLFMSFTTYIIDALLNFPISRPILQMAFIIIGSLVIIIFSNIKTHTHSHKSIFFKRNKMLLFVCLTVLTPITYISFLTFQSLKGQNTLIAEFNNGKLNYPLNKIEELVPNIPNISVTTLPISSMKARYYIENGKPNEALNLLRQDKKTNPYLGFNETLTSQVFNTLNIKDSAVHYAKLAYKKLPIPPHIANYLKLLIEKKDTLEIDRVFIRDSAKHNANVWRNYLVASNSLRPEGSIKSISIANRALEIFPNNKDFVYLQKEALLGRKKLTTTRRLYEEGNKLFEEKNYIAAAETFLASASIDSLSFSYFENAGLAFYLAGEFNKAIPCFDKVINELNPQSGKSEYFKGLTLISLDRIGEACIMFKAAKAYKYLAADQALQTHCK